MKFVSTRGEAPALSFEGALLAALASDGGLYMPEAWPRLSEGEIAGLAGVDYADAAFKVMRPFLDSDPCLADLETVLEEAYGSFHHRPRPLAPGRAQYLHSGAVPRADAGLQGSRPAARRPADEPRAARRGEHVTIVGATSGDTGVGGDRRLSRPRGARHLHAAIRRAASPTCSAAR